METITAPTMTQTQVRQSPIACLVAYSIRKLPRTVLAVLIIAAGASSCFSQSVASKIEDGGVLDYGLLPDQKLVSNLDSRLRTFLWAHYQHRKPATIVTKRYSLEGELNRATYTIEADAGGKWFIRIHIKRLLSDRKNPVHKKTEIVEFKAYRVEQTQDDSPLGNRGSPSAPVSNYRLRLGNASGKTILVI